MPNKEKRSLQMWLSVLRWGLSWIFPVGSKGNHKVLPYKRGRGKFGTEREERHTHQGDWQSEDEGGDWSDAVTRVLGILLHQNAERATRNWKSQGTILPWAWGRSAILMTPEYKPSNTGLGLLAKEFSIRE